MENEFWGAIFGGVGVLLRIVTDEWQISRRHTRECELTRLDVEIMQAEAIAAPKLTGSSGGSGGDGSGFGAVLKNTKMPHWVGGVRGMMRPLLSFLVLVAVGGGFLFLLGASGERVLTGSEEYVFSEFADVLQFLLLLIFTFYFGTKSVRR